MDIKKMFYGEYGGQFVPETLIPALDELDHAFENAIKNENFIEKFNSLLRNYAGRPTPIYFAERFSRKYGLKLYLKREDLLHTGAHKINNTIGQGLLTSFMGKKRIIAETGAGQHGVATATVAALLGLECIIYMGKLDAKRQEPNVKRMKILGAEVVEVENGSMTLKDAMNEALRDWVKNVKNTHYIIGSTAGPYPFPKIVAYFQSVIGKEARDFFDKNCILPDYVIACVGGGSNAMGIFQGFLDTNVRLIGVEAGGKSNKIGEHAMTLNLGKKGILHGSLSYLLCDDDGQVAPVHSISAGLDYPGVGPQHAYFKDSGKIKYDFVRDNDALQGFFELSRLEGIIPALESSHAIGYVIKNQELFKDKVVLLNLSGRGDKDMKIIEKKI
ncbi:MAG TPA: tryptophan synthase subunit beta [Spirochaetota bacterium]|nr:tryptophan synthase subunit beta [Spirochaetota bacterium]HOM38210.1 tryptophan synthase subunit beta [Spirochaetota bacterium]HPQ48572.1 tryptophan synthase subunit beta [Spirochaetota bacterium]